MAKKTAVEATKTYADMHRSLRTMNEAQIVVAMQQVLQSENPRIDMLTRLIGRYNKLRAKKVATSVLGLLATTPKEKRDVNAALLGNDR
jgi:hypothetical protein